MYPLYCLTILLIIILVLIQYGDTTQKENFKNYSGLTNHSDTPWTIDDPTKTNVITILKQIMNMINKKTGMSYVFSGFDRLDQDVIDTNSIRYTSDFFAGEMRNLETRRFIIIFVLNLKTKEVQVEHINLSNAFKSPDKMFMDSRIPELIITDDNLLKNEYHIMGLSKSKIDFGILKEGEGITRPDRNAKELRGDIMPVGMFTAIQNPQAIFPSRRQSRCWDTSGANYTQKQTDLKMGINNSPMIRMPEIYDNPTVNRQREWNTDYKGMFDLVDSAGNGAGRGVARSP
jgi:hypothetical protein